MPQQSITLNDFPLYSRWTVADHQITEGPETVYEHRTFSISGIPSGSTIQSAAFSASLGTPYGGVNTLTINNQAVGLGLQTVSLTPTASGNGDYTVNFVFKAEGVSDIGDGLHGGTVMVGAPTVTVTYTLSEEEEEKEEEEIILEGITGNNICLFPPNATDFSDNGIAVLSPFSCVVHEEAGGDYSIQMEHPMDVHGLWTLIQEESLIRCPVPEKYTPRVVLPAVALWRVTAESAPLYSVLPTYTKAKTDVDAVINDPSIWQWQYAQEYTPGELVVMGGGIYRCVRPVQYISPTSGSDAWRFIVNVDGTGGSTSPQYIYNAGTIAETLTTGEIISYLGDYNGSYIRARSLRGVAGYVRRADAAQTQDDSGQTVIQARHITTQVFRVQSITVNADIRTVSVYATHISYDLGANRLYDCQVTEASPASALAIMQGATVNPDSRLIVCPVESPLITQDWSWGNPISALLDPDTGMVPTLRAQLIRDNADFFIIGNDNPPEGPTLEYGKNLLGISWEKALDDVVTRVLPRGEKADGTALLLPELFVDSPNSDQFALVYTEILNVGCKIGSEITHADGRKQTLTEDDCYQMMRTAAQNRFDLDQADAVTVQLSVNVLLLGDTEEYKQYRGLQRLHLYDAVPIKYGPAGFAARAQISEYSWDAVPRRYQSISVGKIFSFGGRTVAGYNVADGAITYNKLSPGAVKKIRSL